MLEFDHIAVAADSLEAGVAWVRACLGVDIPVGGVHPLMGTHNHVMQLGDAAFLEVIAVDPEASVDRPRWFDLDRFTGPPRLQTWIARCPEMAAALAAMPVDVGVPLDLTRGDMFWQLTVREDGTLPYEGAFPAVIDWPPEQFPVPNMADLGCGLRRLVLEHPLAQMLEADLSRVISDARIVVEEAPVVRLWAEIETPFGMRVLG